MAALQAEETPRLLPSLAGVRGRLLPDNRPLSLTFNLLI
jgi:hypothetical protein